MTVRIPPSTANGTSEVFTIDFRETAPALSNKTMYVDDPLASRWGGRADGIARRAVAKERADDGRGARGGNWSDERDGGPDGLRCSQVRKEGTW